MFVFTEVLVSWKVFNTEIMIYKIFLYKKYVGNFENRSNEQLKTKLSVTKSVI